MTVTIIPNLLWAAADPLDMFIRYGAIAGALMALVGIIKLIQKWQFQREQIALKRFQEGIFDDEGEGVKTVPKGRLLRKVRPTKVLLAYVGKKDKWFDPDYLKQVAKEVFTTFREAWEDRDYDLLKGYVTVEFFQEYMEALDSRKNKERLQSFADLRLTRMEIVHFVASSKPDQHSFTVLITAESLLDSDEDEEEDDAYEDSDDDRIAYQEFWTFKRRKRWQLAKLRDVSTSDAVQEQNILAPDWFKEFRDRINKDPDILDFVCPS